MNSRPNLVCWFNSPPRVERGALNSVTYQWGSPVTYAFAVPLRAERVALGWDDGQYGAASTLARQGSEDARRFVGRVLQDNQDAVHLVAGFSPPVGDHLRELVKHVPSERIAVYSERPGAYGPIRQRILRRLGIPVKHRWLYHRFRRRIGVLLPLGDTGVAAFERFGWRTSQMAPFMYCPDSATRQGHSGVRDGGTSVRILYVGRYSRFTKGTDILMEAFDTLDRGGWDLDLVGGYGDFREEVDAWADRHSHVRSLGSVATEVIPSLMQSYDVCVVPSRFDGWNVVVNEALEAGIGVLCSDEAVSDELVRASGAGAVFEAGSPAALAGAIAAVLDNPTVLDVWKENARRYATRISPDTVAEYLIATLDAKLLTVSDARIQRPWI